MKLIFKEETVLFCIVHGEQSVLPESRSQLEPDEFKPVFLYLVPFHGVSVRIWLFFSCFSCPLMLIYQPKLFYEWEQTYVDRFNWSNTLQNFSFGTVHGEHWSVLPESPSELEPDELKPVDLYLVAFHGVSVRIALVIFFIVFLIIWCSYTNSISGYEWQKT